MNRCINLYAGPGTGKSTTCAALFAELKYSGHNTEMILEYAKDAAWENRGPKLFAAQQYIYGKQSFRLCRVAGEVEFIVTDCPILMGLVYMPEDFPMPSLRNTIREDYNQYENLDIFLNRSTEKPYNPNGRLQTEPEAIEKDKEIRDILIEQKIDFYDMTFNRTNVRDIMHLMKFKGWI
jgi:hypothetical protein